MAVCPVLIYKIYPAKSVRTNPVKHKLVGCQSTGSSIYMIYAKSVLGTRIFTHTKSCFRILLQILLLEA